MHSASVTPADNMILPLCPPCFNPKSPAGVQWHKWVERRQRDNWCASAEADVARAMQLTSPLRVDSSRHCHLDRLSLSSPCFLAGLARERCMWSQVAQGPLAKLDLQVPQVVSLCLHTSPLMQDLPNVLNHSKLRLGKAHPTQEHGCR